MSEKSSASIIPVGAQTLDRGMIMICSFLHLLQKTYKNISKIKTLGAATLITKENTKT